MDSVAQSESPTRDLFDRKHGSLVGMPGVIHAKATTLRVSQPLTGDVQTFNVETFRQRDEPAKEGERTPTRDHVFIEYTDRGNHVRLYLPPEVSTCIARQRDALTTRSRKRGAKAAAVTRKALGIVPNFTRKRKP
jgi:hypothetical protein